LALAAFHSTTRSLADYVVSSGTAALLTAADRFWPAGEYPLLGARSRLVTPVSGIGLQQPFGMLLVMGA
jgi:hypothetical protein